LSELIAELPPCLIGMEACGGAHEWARRFAAYGHRVGIMMARFVAPYRKSSKNDGNDLALRRFKAEGSILTCFRILGEAQQIAIRILNHELPGENALVAAWIDLLLKGYINALPCLAQYASVQVCDIFDFNLKVKTAAERLA
jgi:hypothetical protein